MYRKIDITIILSEAKNLFFKIFNLTSNIQYLKSLSFIGRAIFLATCYLLLSSSLNAQNLVPNYSFEDTIECGAGSLTGYVKYWTGWQGEGGLIYCTSQCPTSGSYFGVPANEDGRQYAHTGVSYVGMYTYLDSSYYPAFSNYRNYIQDSLLSPLLAGKKYFVTFYVSLADTFSYACNNIGAYFSDSALVWNDHVKSYLLPQVSNDIVHNPLTDKVNWMRVSGNFIAAGGEQFIIIGNFVDDAHSDTTFVNSLQPVSNAAGAFYYIDDVIVSTDSTYADSLFTGVQTFKRNEPSANVYPNPSSTLLNVAVNMSQIKSGSICLYNTTGEKVRCETLSGNITSISITDLPSGMYYYRITDANGNLVKADKVTIIK